MTLNEVKIGDSIIIESIESEGNVKSFLFQEFVGLLLPRRGYRPDTLQACRGPGGQRDLHAGSGCLPEVGPPPAEGHPEPTVKIFSPDCLLPDLLDILDLLDFVFRFFVLQFVHGFVPDETRAFGRFDGSCRIFSPHRLIVG